MFLTKRQKITISSVLMAAMLLTIPLFKENQVFVLAGLIAASYGLSFWAIYSTFTGYELVTLFVLPVTLTTSFALFLAQFPTSFQIQLLLALVYIVAMYTILLASNIFNVSIERNIPLVRAGRTIGYLATLFVSFAFFTLLFGLGLNVFLFAVISFIVAVLLISQGLWQIDLKATNLRWLVTSSLVGGLLVGELALALGFWPLDPPKIGLALTATIYVFLGILQHQQKKDLTFRTTFEYLFVAAVLLVFLLFTTSWGV